VNLPRIVTAEMLDVLPPGDPAARRSRRDLRRVHRVMRTRAVLRRALQGWRFERERPAPLRVLELGAGDGTLLLGVAQALAHEWPRVELVLLDRQRVVEPATLERYAALGWQARAETADVLDWAAQRGRGGRWDLIVANLFIHHFEGTALAALLGAVAARTDRFLACEPRRARLALGASHLVGALGANAVTREDAVLSVHAGFRGGELSALWPGARDEWELEEFPAALFSHCLRATRRAAARATNDTMHDPASDAMNDAARDAMHDAAGDAAIDTASDGARAR